ncbi:MAG: hydroxymethylbilane synthase [Deltaproteobacteria bacterium]|nr:hydroxymethylbilane synthase [Deltaproteobacteria bacterium]
MNRPIRIGTRGSKLALWQANWTKSFLQTKFPSTPIELTIIKTQGDKILDVPLAKVGGKGLFVKEIEQALLAERIDIAVHSMKDMPADIPEGLCIGAIPERENPFDVFISRSGAPFKQLPAGSIIGTSSLRRGAQLRYTRADIVIQSIRGNLDTRLKKLKSENFDALVLAAAGVKRLNLEHKITEYLDDAVMLPAIGQGALCVEIRKDDPTVELMVAAMEHAPTRAIVSGERAFLKRLEGGCQVPIAGHGHIINNTFTLTGLVAEVDGTRLIKSEKSGPVDSAETIGIELAEKLLDRGASIILEKLKKMAIKNDGS